MEHILKCKECGIYSIKNKCPKCGCEMLRPMPPKFSPDDKYGKYRRQVKSLDLKKEGLL
ncbi:MAG: RNA-protein complex protein Nop10 [Nanoarchaeota archaeon]|nr:RNA-protein complex protein Nop10 [Nanoarchaeota archaeon]MBU1004530.1 RNA-protein complex protein Nop10 [Nanoarchaeota archaeon]MBU1945933.1 RNA-protein complex protein Nop10 [Nanoarchaeota archaeon]